MGAFEYAYGKMLISECSTKCARSISSPRYCIVFIFDRNCFAKYNIARSDCIFFPESRIIIFVQRVFVLYTNGWHTHTLCFERLLFEFRNVFIRESTTLATEHSRTHCVFLEDATVNYFSIDSWLSSSSFIASNLLPLPVIYNGGSNLLHFILFVLR